MKILIDECTPRLVKKRLVSYTVNTAQEMGWGGVKNGELLKLAEESFDVLITCDQSIRYQQNLKDRKLAFIVLPSNQVPIVEKLIADIDSALTTIKEGDFVEIPFP